MENLSISHEEQHHLIQKTVGGFSWFKWIAGLSLVNTVVNVVFHGNISFIFGLGLTQVVDAAGASYAVSSGQMAIYIALGINFIIAGAFFIAGRLAINGKLWAAYTALVIYVLDSLIFLLVTDYLSIAVHAYASFQIIQALISYNRLKKHGFLNESADSPETSTFSDAE